MYTNKKTNNEDRPRNVKMTFKIADSFISANNTVISADIIMKALGNLNNLNIFKLVSIPAQTKKSIAFDDSTKRGNMNCGYIINIDTENTTADIVIYASSVENIKKVKDKLIFAPRIRVDRDGNFSTFLSFDLIMDE